MLKQNKHRGTPFLVTVPFAHMKVMEKVTLQPIFTFMTFVNACEAKKS